MNRTRFNTQRSGLLASAPRGFKIMFGLMAFMVASIFIMVIGLMVASNINTGVAEGCKVSGKHVAVVDGYSQYRINTENCGSFMIADAVFKGQFDSADVYGQIHEGQTYDFTKTGFRVPILSAFPNIVDFKESGRF